jgi:type VI secretion system protein ImpF
MAADQLPAGFKPSVLDKLTDPDSGGTSDRGGYSESQMIRAVRRDLEDLLNTRRPTFAEMEIESLDEVRRSVLAYGLPDFANYRGMSDETRRQVAREIADAITTFEPRLTDVEVSLKDPAVLQAELKDKYQLTALYFHIGAKLRMDPCPPVAFETVLELTQGRHRVEGPGGAEGDET